MNKMAQTGINYYKGMGGMGIHAVTDVMTDSDFAELGDMLVALNSATFQIVGAGRRDQAFAFARQRRQVLPKMRITFRNFENETGDDGNWKKHPYAGDPQRWFDVHQRFMDADLSVLTDNESSEGDFRGYVDWELGVLDLIAKHPGYKADFMRLAVGWPGDGSGGSTYQYDQFDRLYKRIAEFPDGRFSISPNEYYPWPNGDVKYTGRYMMHFMRASSVGAFIPNLFIGEFGGLYRYPDNHLDSGKGWSSPELHLDSVQYMETSIKIWEMLYKPYGIPVNFFCWGDSAEKGRWQYLRIDKDKAAKKYLIDQAAKGRFVLPKVETGQADTTTPPELPPPPIEVFPPPAQPIPASAPLYAVDFTVSASRPYINVRKLPVSGTILRTLNPGSAVQILKQMTATDGSIWVKVICYSDDVVGWVSTQKGVITFKEI